MTPVDDRPTELLRGIRHSNPAVRIRAARGLAKLATPLRQAFPILLAAVNDPEQGVREAAIQALGTYGQEVLPTLMELLNHPDKYVRRNAVWGHREVRPGRPLRYLLPLQCPARRRFPNRRRLGPSFGKHG